MRNTGPKNGLSSPLVLILGFIVVAAVGYYMYSSSQNPLKRSGQSITVEAPQTTNIGYTGAVITDSRTPYLDFTQADYEKALTDGKDIILIYYADWCPICRGEAPLIEAGFKQLDIDNAVGFRINYNDGQTDAYEKQLAEDQEVTYQHTKVILRNGTVVLKDGNPWDTETFLQNINTVL